MAIPEPETDDDVDKAFPNLLRAGYRVSSEFDPAYNCIAHAANDKQHWWQPGIGFVKPTYWPAGIPHDHSILGYTLAFRELGYDVTDNAELEVGFEKIALFAKPDGTISHAARQLRSGAWTSKLGEGVDIVHNELQGVEGTIYGQVVQIMRRPRVQLASRPRKPRQDRSPRGRRG